jgi:hypothetical protein
LRGVETSEDLRSLRTLRQRGVGQLVDVATEKQVFRRDSDGVADVDRDELVVSRENLDVDALFPERVDNGSRVVTGWVNEGQKSEKG